MTASPSSTRSTNGEQLSSSPALPTQTATSTAGTCTPEHPSQQQEEEQEEEYLFSCRCDSAKAVSSLLSCLVTSESSKKAIQPVTVFLSPTALTFHVHATSGKQSQISVDLNKSLFCDFQVTTGEFSVNLTSVLECLHVLGNNHYLERTKLSWAYSPLCQMFEMELLEEGGVLSTAAIPGLLSPSSNNASSLALAFKQSPVVSRILLKSEWLKQAWNELEHVVGATTCTVQVSSQALQLATVGHNAGECIVSLPANTASTQGLLLSLETNTTTSDSIPVSYPWSSFKLGMKGLDIAEETCLTMNQDGMMAIQHQILFDQDEEHANFCDFLMASLTNNTEEEEEEGSTTTTTVAPPPLSLGWKSQEEKEKDSDSEEEEEQSPPISAAPIFASVVDEDASVATNTTSRHVARRRRRAPSSSVASSIHAKDESSSSSSSSDDDDEKMSATPQRQQRRRRGRHDKRQRRRQLQQDGSSSPEIEYGNDSD